MIDTVQQILDTPVVINCFSLIILVIFLLNNQHRTNGIKTRQFILFRYIILSNILLLAADAIIWIVTDNPNPAYRTTQVCASTVYYALDPLPSYFFIRFTDEVINISPEKQKRLNRWYLVPVVLHLLISLATPYTGWFFQIDAANVYHRGSLLPVSFVLSFVLLIIAAAKVLHRYIKAGKEYVDVAKNVTQYGWLLRVIVIPLIGGLIQVFFNNVTYVWNITVIALLLVYINNQNAEITTDTLTGLYNRRQAFVYFERFARERARDKANTAVAVVVLDINSFKSINDQYGHIMGDEAIISVARSLETEFHWDDFICRFGGDEYMVISKHGQEAVVKAAIERVNNNLAKLHENNSIPFSLSVSAGYAILSKKANTLDALFQKADTMLFEQKAKLMRRASDRKKPVPSGRG